MGSSGLIYAAIVAAWAAVLVPRWVRRNEEVEQAREVDLARGVRVLAQPAASARGARTHARHEPPPVVPADPPASVVEPRGDHGHATRRRRRVLWILVLALVAVTVGTVVDVLPLWAVAVPGLVLALFLRLARRAAAAEARRRARPRRRGPAAAVEPAPRRIAVLDEPEPVEPADPDGWQPVPVPLPTYITKPKAPEPATRTIDLSRPGAWTSGRLDPAGSIVQPRPVRTPQPVADDVEDLPEHRPAVGD